MAEIVSTVWIAHVTDAYMCIAVKDSVRGGMTMTEYIRREDAIDTVLDVYCNTPDINLSCEKFEAAIRKIPAADIAPVVRCRDCKHAWIHPCGYVYCHRDGRSAYEMTFNLDSFCSYGERKEGFE